MLSASLNSLTLFVPPHGGSPGLLARRVGVGVGVTNDMMLASSPMAPSLLVAYLPSVRSTHFVPHRSPLIVSEAKA